MSTQSSNQSYLFLLSLCRNENNTCRTKDVFSEVSLRISPHLTIDGAAVQLLWMADNLGVRDTLHHSHYWQMTTVEHLSSLLILSKVSVSSGVLRADKELDESEVSEFVCVVRLLVLAGKVLNTFLRESCEQIENYFLIVFPFFFESHSRDAQS